MPAVSTICMQFTARTLLSSKLYAYKSSSLSICYQALEYKWISVVANNLWQINEWKKPNQTKSHVSSSIPLRILRNFTSFCLNRKHTNSNKTITNWRCKHISFGNTIALTKKKNKENEKKPCMTHSLTLSTSWASTRRANTEVWFFFISELLYLGHTERG